MPTPHDAQLAHAVALETQLEFYRKRAEDLEKRIKAVLNSEPESASRALSWIGRAEQSEKLLIEIALDPKIAATLPPSLLTRIKAQLHTVVILRRDQEAMGERPSEEEWWQSWREAEGRVTRTSAEKGDGPLIGDAVKVVPPSDKLLRKLIDIETGEVVQLPVTLSNGDTITLRDTFRSG